MVLIVNKFFMNKSRWAAASACMLAFVFSILQAPWAINHGNGFTIEHAPIWASPGARGGAPVVSWAPLILGWIGIVIVGAFLFFVSARDWLPSFVARTWRMKMSIGLFLLFSGLLLTISPWYVDETVENNVVVQAYRKEHPDDPRSDDELTLAIGDNHPGKYDGYTDFALRYRRLKDWTRQENYFKTRVAPIWNPPSEASYLRFGALVFELLVLLLLTVGVDLIAKLRARKMILPE